MALSAGNLAQALYSLDRLDEAETWADRVVEIHASEDAWQQTLWRQVKAKVYARRGEFAEAERLAGEAVAISDETDMLNLQGDAHADLGEVLQLAGKPDEAAAALKQALARYERKENIVMAERVHARLAELQPSETAAGTT
jgi:tetratricopeptide (TPR) repeat protein